MKPCFISLLLLSLSLLKVYGQSHYDGPKVLSGEELFLKQSGTSKILAKPGQKYLILDVSPVLGSFHRYRFFPGDQVKFRMRNETIRFDDMIASISDSSFTIGVVNEAVNRMDYQEILLKDIRLFKVHRRIPLVSQAAPLLPFAGLLFIGADFFNKGMDNKRYTTDGGTIAIGAGMMAAGFICYKITFSSPKINNRNKLKVIETY
jgi:hypothetical protein